MTDDQLYADLNRFVAVSQRADGGHSARAGERWARLVTDPKAADALEASLKNIEEMTRQLNAGEGSLGKLLQGRFVLAIAELGHEQHRHAGRRS